MSKKIKQPDTPEATVETYRKLPDADRRVFQFLSVLYQGAPVHTLLAGVQRAELRTAAGAPHTAASLKLLLHSWLMSGIQVSENGGVLKVLPQITETATRDAIRDEMFDTFVSVAQRIVPLAQTQSWSYQYFQNLAHAYRTIRIRLYQHDEEKLWNATNLTVTQFGSQQREHPLRLFCARPFDREWFESLPKPFAFNLFDFLWTHLQVRLEPLDDMIPLLQHWMLTVTEPSSRDMFTRTMAEILLLRGQLTEAENLFSEPHSPNALSFRARLLLLQGDVNGALAGYQNALATLKTQSQNTAQLLPDSEGAMYALALAASRQYRPALAYLKKALRAKDIDFGMALIGLHHLVQFQVGDPPTVPKQHPGYPIPLNILVKALTIFWMDTSEIEYWITALAKVEERARDCGYAWLAAEADMALARADAGHTIAPSTKTFYETQTFRPLVQLFTAQEPWERALQSLEHLAESAPKETQKREKRLHWILQPVQDSWELEAREVSVLASGKWSRGKEVTPRQLASHRDNYTYLTQADLIVCSHVAHADDPYGYSSRILYEFAPSALAALANHPHVYLADGTHLEISSGTPELVVRQQENEVLIELTPKAHPEEEVVLVRETSTRFRAVQFSAAHRKIADILQRGLRVPVQHKDKAIEALTRIAPLIALHSDFDLADLPAVDADLRPHILLVPAGQGLRVEMYVRPLPEGSFYKPGSGGETVVAGPAGERVQARRKPKLEQELAQEVVAACKSLEHAEEGEWQWMLPTPEECLEFLDELQELKDSVVLEWPKGEKMRLAGRAGLSNLSVKVSSGQNWFEASGEVRLDDNTVYTMAQLLELMGSATGRFIQLGDNNFLALGKEFRRRLDDFAALSEVQGKKVRVHALAASAVESLLEGAAAVNTDQAWKKQVDRYRQAVDFTPTLPSTLRAELRDYQVEGFQWLSRLERWGAGACLADDMGLGKTLQALAMLLSLAPDGPSIVVAPTSVCLNWMNEAQKFAPSLNPILFGPGDRQAMLTGLKPFDLMICSYGLLHQEAEKLAAVSWRAAVLDEAQAIKNTATRRSQAAMNLDAKFRMITTGTPIENHLGELWNLFRFINPGLLGSLQQFNRRFAGDIERRQDKEARRRLKKLIQPFILRRMKEQVLDELPPRTEVLLHVELSPEETAFYEALRRRAVDSISGAAGPPQQKRLRILAEIMKLRRACCNPRLANTEIAISSSKLAVFLELVDELLENRHKALVFSQFVDHLTILRETLDARGIKYQYLDGSTPQKARQKAVEAFQGGEGDLFLISLKAGGLGLNLTAADYVIHMDPWWNPAAEDQASDRAHRIGQLRPVTVYRLVTKDTIESKIVDLHRHKRDLAESLLEGTETAGNVSVEDLLGLLREE